MDGRRMGERARAESGEPQVKAGHEADTKGTKAEGEDGNTPRSSSTANGRGCTRRRQVNRIS